MLEPGSRECNEDCGNPRRAPDTVKKPTQDVEHLSVAPRWGRRHVDESMVAFSGKKGALQELRQGTQRGIRKRTADVKEQEWAVPSSPLGCISQGQGVERERSSLEHPHRGTGTLRPARSFGKDLLIALLLPECSGWFKVMCWSQAP